MTREQIEEYIEMVAPDCSIALPDGLDEAFVGVDTESEDPRAVYSMEKCIEILSEDMTSEQASEYFWYNVAGSCGKGYPLYISTPVVEGDSPYT